MPNKSPTQRQTKWRGGSGITPPCMYDPSPLPELSVLRQFCACWVRSNHAIYNRYPLKVNSRILNPPFFYIWFTLGWGSGIKHMRN